MSALKDIQKEIKKLGFFKGLKSGLKCVFKYDQWQHDQYVQEAKEWELKKEDFYLKAKPVVENYIKENGYEGIQYKQFLIDGKEYKLDSYFFKGPEIKQIFRVISESFQMEYFGKTGLFEEDYNYNYNDPKTYANSFVLLDLSYYSFNFPFCGTSYYLKKRNPFLKYLIEYHKLYPDTKINLYLLGVVNTFFIKVADMWTLDKFGEDYYDKIGNLSEEERRQRAWNSEELHQLLDSYTDPNLDDNALLFAKNIGDEKLTNDLAVIAVDIIFMYINCKYNDRHEIFFTNEDSKVLKNPSEIKRILNKKEMEEDQ